MDSYDESYIADVVVDWETNSLGFSPGLMSRGFVTGETIIVI